MRLTIIGAGAIGGTIGAHLIRSGNDVLLCDSDVAHVDAINRDGLTIEGPVESFTVPAKAVIPERRIKIKVEEKASEWKSVQTSFGSNARSPAVLVKRRRRFA